MLKNCWLRGRVLRGIIDRISHKGKNYYKFECDDNTSN